MQEWYQAADPQFQKKQRLKAKELRRSQWWKAQLAKGVCHFCQQSFPAIDLTMDHLIPISRGGETKKSNVVTACKECNTQKKSKTPVELILETWDAENNS